MAEQSRISVETVDVRDWPAIAARFSDYNYEQAQAYAAAAAIRVGATVRFLAVRSNTGILGAAAVRLKAIPLLGRGVAYVAGGPMMQRRGDGWDVGRARAVLAALKGVLVHDEGNTLLLRLPVAPPLPNDEAQAALRDLGYCASDRVRSYRTVVVDLSPGPDVLRAGLAGKWRTDLNFSCGAGLSIEHGTLETMLDRFLDLFHEMHAAKQFRIERDPRVFFGLPVESTGLQILIATKDGRDVAGHVASLLGDTAVYLFGATNEIGRHAKAGYLMQWTAFMLAMERGLRWYDLGGTDVDANPGSHRFKKRTGGREILAVGPYQARPGGMIGLLIDRLLLVRKKARASGVR